MPTVCPDFPPHTHKIVHGQWDVFKDLYNELLSIQGGNGCVPGGDCLSPVGGMEGSERVDRDHGRQGTPKSPSTPTIHGATSDVFNFHHGNSGN